MTILCAMKNLSLSFGSKIIFKDAQIHINHGDRIGLIGPNGKGKSSLFNVLLGTVGADKVTPPFIFDRAKADQGENLEYSVFLVPQQFNFDEENPQTIKSYFFVLYPELAKIHDKLEAINKKMEEDYHDSLLDEQNELLIAFDHLKGWDLVNKYQSYLKSFGIYDDEKLVSDLSGGEQRKILLSLGLSSPANLILWDEPTNHLDIETIKIFESELLQCQKTFIIISHDRYLLSKVSNKILHINSGVIKEFKGDYTNYLSYLTEMEASRSAKLERLQNSMRRETEWMRQGVKARRTKSKKRIEGYGKISSDVQELKDQARKSVQMTLTASTKKTKKLMEFKDVTLAFDDKVLFKNLNTSIFKGQRIGLVGPNGCGKTSLVNLITGIIQCDSGEVKTAEDLSINYFSQKREEIDKAMTPFELLGKGQDHVVFEDGRRQHVIGYFQNFLFNKDEIKRPLSTFSGGEIARLQLASQLMNFGDLWIFDEPTNDLDIDTIEILEDKLEKFQGSVIIISHDRTFLENVTDTIWILDNKAINIFEGGYSQAAPYIEAMCLEKEIDIQEHNSLPEVVVVEPVKNTVNKDNSKRLKEIRLGITKKEQHIEELEGVMDKFTFSETDHDKNKLFEQLQYKKNTTEEELLELYEEQTLLS